MSQTAPKAVIDQARTYDRFWPSASVWECPLFRRSWGKAEVLATIANGAFDPSLQIGALGFRSAHGSLTPISLAAFSCFDDSVESQPPSVAMYGWITVGVQAYVQEWEDQYVQE